MRQPIRFFSLGLLVTAILSLVFYIVFEEKEPKEIESEVIELSTDEMILSLKEDGYRVISEEQYIALSLAAEQADEITNDDKDELENDENEKDNTDIDEAEEDNTDEDVKVSTHTFTTKDNVVSQDIADVLIENNIIENRREFLDYLQDNDYMKYIQIGTFTVNSDMTYEEIAKVITTYPGN